MQQNSPCSDQKVKKKIWRRDCPFSDAPSLGIYGASILGSACGLLDWIAGETRLPSSTTLSTDI